MTTLAAPQKASITITTPGQSVPVTCTTGDKMQVDWVSPGGVTGSRLVMNETVDIGPLADNTVVTFTALAGSPTYSAGKVVTAEYNNLTGGMDLTAGGVPVSVGSASSIFPATSYATKGMLNNAGSGATFLNALASPSTYQVQTVLESDFDMIQIGIINTDTVAVAGVNACAVVWGASQADNSAAANYSAATWTDMTGNAGTTSTLAANTSGSTMQGVVTWFDPLPLPSVARSDSGKTLPGLSIRIGYPSAVNQTYLPGPMSSPSTWESDTTANAGRFYRVRAQSVAAASNATKAALTVTASAANWPCVLIRYWPRAGAPKTIMVCGDSEANATGGPATGVALTRYGWAEMLRATYSTPTNPIEIVNGALGGALSTHILGMANTLVPAVPNAVAIMPNGTPNGTSSSLTTTDVNNWRSYKAKARALMDSIKMPYFFFTMFPIDPIIHTARPWGATDSLRQSMNASDIGSGQGVIDFATTLSGTISGGQIPLVPTLDGLHTTDSGNASLVPLVAQALKIS